MFIMLHDISNEVVYVNTDYIIHVGTTDLVNNGDTVVSTTAGGLIVRESVSRIMEKIEGRVGND